MISAKLLWALVVGKGAVTEGLEEGEAHRGLLMFGELIQEGIVLETEFSLEEVPSAPCLIIFLLDA
jgi:hypothetical protein